MTKRRSFSDKFKATVALEVKCDRAGPNKIHRMNAIIPAEKNRPVRDFLQRRIIK